MVTARWKYAVILFAAGVAGIAACVASDFADGQFACNPDGEAACPPGLLCARDGLCRTRDLADAQGPVVPPDAPAEASDGATEQAPDASEAGDACASATWALLTDAHAPFGVALGDDGRLYVSGQSSSEGWVAELDTCDGGVVREKTFAVPGTTTPTVNVLLATPTAVLGCGGGAQPDALAGTIDKALTTPAFSAVTGSGFSGFNGIAVATDGAMWVSGNKQLFATPQQGWVVRTTAPKCEATLGVGTAIAQGPSGSMYVMVDSAGGTSQVSLIDPACAVGATVGPPLAVGTSISTSSLLVQSGVLYAGGTAMATGNNRFVFLAALDLATKVWTVTPLDPNPLEPDILNGAVTDTSAFFLGVTQRAGFGTGTATIYRFDPPYTKTSIPAAITLPFGALQLAARSLAVAPAGQDGVYIVGGSIDGTGGIARCRKSGDCSH